MFALTNRETSENEFLLPDSLRGKPSGDGMELMSATGRRFTTTGSAHIFMRTPGWSPRVGRLPDGAQDGWLAESITSVGPTEATDLQRADCTSD